VTVLRRITIPDHGAEDGRPVLSNAGHDIARLHARDAAGCRSRGRTKAGVGEGDRMIGRPDIPGALDAHRRLVRVQRVRDRRAGLVEFFLVAGLLQRDNCELCPPSPELQSDRRRNAISAGWMPGGAVIHWLLNTAKVSMKN